MYISITYWFITAWFVQYISTVKVYTTRSTILPSSMIASTSSLLPTQITNSVNPTSMPNGKLSYVFVMSHQPWTYINIVATHTIHIPSIKLWRWKVGRNLTNEAYQKVWPENIWQIKLGIVRTSKIIFCVIIICSRWLRSCQFHNSVLELASYNKF